MDYSEWRLLLRPGSRTRHCTSGLSGNDAHGEFGNAARLIIHPFDGYEYFERVHFSGRILTAREEVKFGERMAATGHSQVLFLELIFKNIEVFFLLQQM